MASVAAYPWVKTAKLTTGVLAAGLLLELPARSLAGWAYSSTIGQLSRDYALTKSKLYLSPQDDNLYPPSPKDYMRFDYIALTDDPCWVCQEYW